MVEAIIQTLIGFCLLVLVFVVVVWVLGALGFAIPAMVLTVLKIILVLIGILILYRAIRPHAGGYLP